MTEFQPAGKLRQHRPLLLALEAIGWLHMTGKANAEFLVNTGKCKRQKCEERKGIPPWYEEIGVSLENIFDWLEQGLKSLYSSWSLSGKPPRLRNLLKSMFLEYGLGKNKNNLVGFLQAGHAMASGVEKNLPWNTSDYLNQVTENHMWLSSAFGYPARNLLCNQPELLTPAGWKRLLAQINELLTELKRLGAQDASTDLDNWWLWREGAVGPNGWLREKFTSTLAETRLPNNEVTLFDQSYVAAALFKSAAAGAILEGGSFPWNDVNLKQQTRWRLLTVGIGAGYYEARSVKIGDWTGARLVLDEIFLKIRRLVEVDLAVGSLLYADDEVCVFSFPGERFGHTSQGYQGGDLQIEDWKGWLTEQIDSYAKEAGLETPPYCAISKPSRSLVGMTAEIRKAKDTMAVPLHRDWTIPDQKVSDGHVCPVCLVRRGGDSGNKQTPCSTCKTRRIGRLEAWLDGKPGPDSIWISEVADANDRLAIITMSLDIEPWLDGSRLDSLRSQAIAEWCKRNPELSSFELNNEKNKIEEKQERKIANPIVPEVAFDRLFEYVKSKLKFYNREDSVFNSLQVGYQYDTDWSSFFSKIVEDRSKAPEWDNLDDSDRARWITHQLFCKLASPGRVYRFQRQAEDFFKVLLAEFREIAAADRNRWRTRRLVIKPDNGSAGSWVDRQTYNGRYGDAPISLLYRKKTDDFLTICNLARVLKPEQDEENLKDSLGGTLELKADEGEYKKKTIILNVKSVSDDAGELGCYCPVIPLELSPVRFRVLVPLQAASKCMDRAVEAWNEQFSRVWDRLPLRIGVVAFPRMTPFQAVIETVRGIEADLTRGNTQFELWNVVHNECVDGIADLEFTNADGRKVQRRVPIVFPDGREDVFYPYMAVTDDKLRFPLDFRHPEGQVYRHVKNLRTGDSVKVKASRIATSFLGNVSERFEKVACRGIDEWRRMKDVWSLIEKTAPSQTALKSAWAQALDKRQCWAGKEYPLSQEDELLWSDLVNIIFRRSFELSDETADDLSRSLRDGLLAWCLEWNIGVLKKKVNRGGVR